MGWVQFGFLAASAAVAVPIVIHLVFGRRARRIDLGTLRFLKIVISRSARRKRLKRWLLLALRMACVALLAMMFARPFLAARQHKGDRRLVVILLDRSASMELVGDRGRLLDVAVQQAQDVAAGCGEGTRIEAAWFDHAVHPLGGTDRPDSPSRSTLSLDELEPPEAAWSTTDYGRALAWARDVCVQSDRGRKEIHLFTDLQRSGLDRTDAEPLPEDIEVHLADLGRPIVNNVAVIRVTPQKTTFRSGETAVLGTTLLNVGQLALQRVPVVLYLTDGRQKQYMRSQVDLEPGATETVQFELTGLAEGLWQGSALVEPDDELPFDDRCQVAFRVAPPLNVLLVDGGPGDTPLTRETYFLEAALRLAPPGERFVDSPFEPTTVTAADGGGLPELKGVDLAVLANVQQISAGDAARLADFVAPGGGLMVFSGENVQADGYGTLHRAGISIGRIADRQTAASYPWRLEDWDRDHPIFRPFRDPQHGDLRRLAFRCYTTLEPDEDVEVLARFHGGDPALLLRRHERGRILWFATACDRDWSDWPRSRLFLPLVHQMLGHLCGLTEGGPVRFAMLDEPANHAPADHAPANHGPADRPGVYDRGTYHQVINVNPRESETDRCSRQEFAARFGFSLPSDEETSSGRAAAAVAASTELRQDEVWHWVLLCLFGVLFVEGFLANRTIT